MGFLRLHGFGTDGSGAHTSAKREAQANRHHGARARINQAGDQPGTCRHAER